MHRSKLPHFFLGLAAVLALTALGLLVTRSGFRDSTKPAQPPVPSPAVSQGNKQTRSTLPEPPATDQPNPPNPEAVKPTPPSESVAAVDKPAAVPGQPAVEPGKPAPVPVKPAAAADPAKLVDEIAKTLEGGNFDELAKLTGKDACDAETLEKLKHLAAAHSLKLKPANGVREVGELELNALTRWSLDLDGADPEHDRILLDLRNNNGQWSLEKLTVPRPPGKAAANASAADSLSVADAFLQAVLNQNFELARTLVDSQTLSDAKIAGLCIIFEEGKYTLRQNKTLRAMFRRGDTAGYLVNVQSPDASQTAQLTLTLRLPPASGNWVIFEINLDQLLADYAQRVAGGDIYYSPLVRNPQGGDTLALYFEFDEDQINPRTRRQLEIVSQILHSDPGKKINLSGHTDAVGTERYNNDLSARRAATVRDFLVTAGVSPTQIATAAKGASQPRRPNVTPSGADDPAGRRANRRTEIYLDF